MTPLGFDLAQVRGLRRRVYPGRWCVGFHGRSPRTGELGTHVVDRDRKQLAEVLARIAAGGQTLVGYNCERVRRPADPGDPGGLRPLRARPRRSSREERLPPAARPSSPRSRRDHVDLSARLRRGGGFPRLKTDRREPRPARAPRAAPTTPRCDPRRRAVGRGQGVQRDRPGAHLGPARALRPRAPGAGRAVRGSSGGTCGRPPRPRVVEVVLPGGVPPRTGGEPVRPEPPREVLYRPPAGVVRPRTEAAAAWYRPGRRRPPPRRRLGGRRARRRPEGDLPDRPARGHRRGRRPPLRRLARGSTTRRRRHRLISADVAQLLPVADRHQGHLPARLRRLRSPTSSAACSSAGWPSRRRAKAEADPGGEGAAEGPGDRPEAGAELAASARPATASRRLFDPAAFDRRDDHRPADAHRPDRAAAGRRGPRPLGEHRRPVPEGAAGRSAVARPSWPSGSATPRWGSRSSRSKRLAILATNIFATLGKDGAVKRRGTGLRGSLDPVHAPNSPGRRRRRGRGPAPGRPAREDRSGECTDPVRFCRVTRRTGKVASGVLLDDADGSEADLPKVAALVQGPGLLAADRPPVRRRAAHDPGPRRRRQPRPRPARRPVAGRPRLRVVHRPGPQGRPGDARLSPPVAEAIAGAPARPRGLRPRARPAPQAGQGPAGRERRRLADLPLRLAELSRRSGPTRGPTSRSSWSTSTRRRGSRRGSTRATRRCWRTAGATWTGPSSRSAATRPPSRSGRGGPAAS